MRPVVIAGARPNFPKVAPVLRSLRRAGVEAALVHTGQHYDYAMSRRFFEDLALPDPDANLGVGSGTHAEQTARVMMAFDAWLEGTNVDAVITVGDVNSTLACALVAVKRGIPVAHVEAGLRSFDRTMPEEINRIVTDSLSSWLFTPSADANDNLLAEGMSPESIHLVGNVMVDSLLGSLDSALRAPIRSELITSRPYGLVTLHRPSLVDDRDRLQSVMGALSQISTELPLVFPMHPRTRANIATFGLKSAPRVQIVEPMGYLEFLRLQAEAALVLTDSGGIQEETTVLGVPCLTLRDNTERPITITHGTNRLVGLETDRIVRGAEEALASTNSGNRPPMWDGRTADRIVAALTEERPAPATQEVETAGALL